MYNHVLYLPDAMQGNFIFIFREVPTFAPDLDADFAPIFNRGDGYFDIFHFKLSTVRISVR